jgi:hypothetical protein
VPHREPDEMMARGDAALARRAASSPKAVAARSSRPPRRARRPPGLILIAPLVGPDGALTAVREALLA